MDLDEIVRLLLKNIWIVIFVLMWLGGAILRMMRGQARRAPAARVAPRAARQRPPVRPRPPRPRLAGRDPVLTSLLEDVEERLEAARSEPTIREIVPWIERGFVEPLRRRAAEGWGRTDLVEGYQVYWSLLKEGLDQRSRAAQESRQGRFLLDLDALGREVRDDVARAVGGATHPPLRHILPVSVPADYALRVYNLDPVSATGIAPVPVPARATREVWRWVLLYHEMGHYLWNHQAGLKAEVGRRFGLKSGPVPLLALSFLTQANIVRHLVGAWMPEIFADVFTAITLGPAATAGARALWRDLDPEALSLIRGIQLDEGAGGFYYDPHPPPQIRFATLVRVLSRGRYVDEASEAWARWEDERGPVDELLLELPGGYGRSIPADPFQAEVDRCLDRLLRTRLRSIGGKRLPDLPGLALPREDYDQVVRAVDRPSPDRLAKADSARWVIAFAALAHEDRGPEAAEAARRVLAYHVRKEPLEKPARVAAATREPVLPTEGLADLMREAVVWREILMPPVTRRFPSARR